MKQRLAKCNIFTYDHAHLTYKGAKKRGNYLDIKMKGTRLSFPNHEIHLTAFRF
jgi:hypothetical protein